MRDMGVFVRHVATQDEEVLKISEFMIRFMAPKETFSIPKTCSAS